MSTVVPERRARTVPISYLESGPETGELILCLHGFPDVPMTWDALAADAAAQGYRVVRPWLPGYAPSRVTGVFDLATVADEMLAFVDELAPSQPVHIVGHDWGALITYVAVRERPSRFRRAVTMSVPHPLVFLGNTLRHPKQIRRSWYILFFQLGALSTRRVRRDDFAFIERLWRDWSPGFAATDGHMQALKTCLRESGDAPLQYYRALRSSATRRLLREGTADGGFDMHVPTLYLHGENDGCIGPEIAARQDRYFRDGFESVFASGAGHFLQLEQPELVNGHILRWLDA